MIERLVQEVSVLKVKLKRIEKLLSFGGGVLDILMSNCEYRSRLKKVFGNFIYILWIG
jgi:hypothetical protein